MRRLIVQMGLALLAPVAVAQFDGWGIPVYPEKLRADAEALRNAIHQAHPDAYRYITKGELDALIDSLEAGLVTPLTPDRFMMRLTPLLQRIGDANLSLRLDAATESRINRDARLLPFNVRLLESGLYITDELKGFRSFAAGSRIISINGLDAERIVRDLSAWLVGEGAGTTRTNRMLEQRFPALFALTYGSTASYVVEVTEPDGRIREEVVAGMKSEEIVHSRKPNGIAMHPWRSTWDEASGALWVQLTTLDPQVLEQSGQKPRAFLEGMLKELNQVQPKALVLDLRGAGGRELGMAEVVFAAIAREPFRVVQGVSARAAQAHALEGLAVLPDDHLAALGRNYLPVQNGMAHLRPDDPRLLPVAPMRSAYTGRVYVVCDGASRDAAAALVMLCKRTGRARLVGEEVGSNAHHFTGGREVLVTLPNSRLTLQVPLLSYLPEGSTDAAIDHGELPHHQIEQQPWGVAKGRDTVRASLLELIRER